MLGYKAVVGSYQQICSDEFVMHNHSDIFVSLSLVTKCRSFSEAWTILYGLHLHNIGVLIPYVERSISLIITAAVF
jgi:hypothetical protein